jgi:hypothetical protein
MRLTCPANSFNKTASHKPVMMQRFDQEFSSTTWAHAQEGEYLPNDEGYPDGAYDEDHQEDLEERLHQGFGEYQQWVYQTVRSQGHGGLQTQGCEPYHIGMATGRGMSDRMGMATAYVGHWGEETDERRQMEASRKREDKDMDKKDKHKKVRKDSDKRDRDPKEGKGKEKKERKRH